jgi:hypothetical protein
MKLRYDPYQVFRCSKTPAGLYARQKWLGEAQSLQWETDFQQLVTAHLDFPLAESQLERAFKRIYENQNLDGTWSRSEPEWNTFLTIHALKNKGLL